MSGLPESQMYEDAPDVNLFTLTEKKCSRCGKIKSFSEFSPDKVTRCGFNSWCKKCRAEYKRKYLEQHKEAVHRQQKKWREGNAESVKESSKGGKQRTRKK